VTESRYQDVFLQAHCLTSLRVQRGYTRRDARYAALVEMTGRWSTQERLGYFRSQWTLLHITITYDMKVHLQHQSLQSNGFCSTLHAQYEDLAKLTDARTTAVTVRKCLARAIGL
jgi:hypothetical protein